MEKDRLLRLSRGMPQDSHSRRLDQFVLRMPDGMRDRIAEAAKASGRSMNAEIIHRLQTTFDSTAIVKNRWDAPNSERHAALGDMIDMMMIVREYLAKLPPDTQISRREAVELSLNSILKLEAEDAIARKDSGEHKY